MKNTKLDMSDADEKKVYKKIIDSVRCGIYGSYYQSNGSVTMMKGEDSRIRNLTLVKIDEMEKELNEESQEVTE